MTMRRSTTLILGSFLLATTLLAQKTPAPPPASETLSHFGAIGLAPGQSLRMTTGLVSPRDAAVPVTIAFDIYTPTADRSRLQVIDHRETRITLQHGVVDTADYTNVGFEEVIVHSSLITETSLPFACIPLIELREGGRTFAVVTHSLIEARKGSAR